MSILNDISINTVVIVLLASSFFSAIFFGLLFYTTHKKKSVLMIFIASGFQLIGSALLFLGGTYANQLLLTLVNIFLVSVIICWIIAVFFILDIETTYVTMVSASIINIIAVIISYVISKQSNFSNVFGYFAGGCLFVYAIVKLFRSRENAIKKEINYSIAVFCCAAIFGFGGALFLIGNKVQISSFEEMSTLSSWYIVMALSISFLVNFTLLYLNFNNLVISVEKLTHIDMLTGVFSRNTFFLMLAQKLSEVRRDDRTITVALLDIDDFKRINDTYGHLVGDDVLSNFTGKLKESLREDDIIGRIGGEEFMLVLEVGNETEGLTALNRIKTHIDTQIFVRDEHITFSCGQMFVDKYNCDLNVQQIVKFVDSQMYEAKALGKDRIV